jgi:hypothetical protein
MTNEPTRLIDEDPGFARLAAASSAEQPSNEQLAKALALVPAAVAASRWSFGWRTLGARMTIGVAMVGLAVLGITTMREERSSSERNVAPVAVAATLALPPPPAELAAPTLSVNDLADAPPKGAAVDRRAATPTSSVRTSAEPAIEPPQTLASAEPPVGRGTFREELALVSTARSALESGDAAACMRAVARYDERFHAGTFAHEIEVLRIEALAASGDRAQAHSRAEKFLAANPKSPYAERVRSLIAKNRPSTSQ